MLLEYSPRLNVHALNRAGALAHGVATKWLAGVTSAPHAVALRTENDRAFVALAGQAEIPIRIDQRPRHMGGNEQYFVCPACQRSVWHIYLPQLCCRHCVRPRLVYGVWRYDGKHRRSAERKAAKLRSRIGAVPGLGSPLPRKPKLVRSDYFEAWLSALTALETKARQELHRAEGEGVEKST